MAINQLIKKLQKSLSEGKGKKQSSSDRIEGLLSELGKKEKKLKRKLAKESNSKKRKDIKLQLKIISTQCKKGMARLKELEKK